MFTSHTVHGIESLAGESPDLAQERRAGIRLPAGNALDAAGRAFDQMMSGPSPLALDGGEIGHGLPAREINLLELRSILLHPSTSVAARDAVWAEVIRRSRTRDETWKIACIGLALPGLKAIAVQTTRETTKDHADDIVSEMMVAFFEALATIDIGRCSIALRLSWRVRRAANDALRRLTRDIPVEPDMITTGAGQTAEDHVDLVLADAVSRGIISRFEAAIIIATRLEDKAPHRLAAELEVSYEALMKRRRRAETRLAEYLIERNQEEPVSRNDV